METKRKPGVNLAIFDKPQQAEEPVFLKLVEEGPEIIVMVVDSKGKPRAAPYLIAFNKNGTLTRFHGVNPDFGFDLDDNGRIRLGRE